MDRLLPVLLMVALAAVVVVLLGLGWRSRLRRQSDVEALPEAPAELAAPLALADGQYVTSTSAGDWLDRIAVHNLGIRTNAELSVHPEGVLFNRAGAGPVYIPAARLTGVRLESGMAGKFVEKDGLLVVSWMLGSRELDTGFRTRRAEDKTTLLNALQELISAAPRPMPIVESNEVSESHEVKDAVVNTEVTDNAPAASPAALVLEDGRIFRGTSYGATGTALGEAVFATGMTGYQETITDPSYARQLVVQTAPHIGNTGVNKDDAESRRIWVAGYIVRDAARRPSNWRSERSLDDELVAQGIVGIQGVDTRAITRHLREHKTMRAGIFSGEAARATDKDLVDAVLASAPMEGSRLAEEVSVDTAYTVEPKDFGWDGEPLFSIAAIDLGIKRMTPVRFAERGVRVHVLPATATLADVKAVNPDGFFMSNGPGDPATADNQVALLRSVLDEKIPYFGICFGNQILGRALGFGTYKLRYGHRGLNQPVMDRRTGKVEITSQNHGFAVDAPLNGATRAPEERYGRVEVSHVSLNDDVVEGLSCLDIPAFSVQYHPEAAAGPHDAAYLFDRFIELMAGAGTAASSAAPAADAKTSTDSKTEDKK